MSKSKKISRRNALKSGIKGSLVGLGFSKAPYAFTKSKVTLRVMGTHVTLQEELRKRAMKDLGINIEFEAKGSAAVLQKAAANPKSFDLYEQWSDSINILWQAKAIQPIEIERIANWDEINSLTKTGRITDNAKICLLYTSPSPRDLSTSRMPSSA